jgi:hypothetical protein
VAGPLCNVALHKDGTVVLVASGRANHFGVATWPSARALGVEATGPNRTGATGPGAFDNYDAYVKLAAGWCIWKGVDPATVVRSDVSPDVCRVAAHKEVAPDRKINPVFNMGAFRNSVRAATTEPEDDMPTEAEVKRAMIGALVDQRDELADAVAREVASQLGPVIDRNAAAGLVFVSNTDFPERGVFVIAGGHLIHVPNPAAFGVISGGDTDAVIKLPDDAPVWGLPLSTEL